MIEIAFRNCCYLATFPSNDVTVVIVYMYNVFVGRGAIILYMHYSLATIMASYADQLSRQFQNIADCVLFGSRVLYTRSRSRSGIWSRMGERAPLLAKAVGGKVLGPRPGLAIVSFWQGILEIVLRALALVSHTSDHVDSSCTLVGSIGLRISQDDITRGSFYLKSCLFIYDFL